MELLEKLQAGDIGLIAKLTNYGYKTVWAQLNGIRTLKPKVKEAAELIIAARQEAIIKYQQTNNKK